MYYYIDTFIIVGIYYNNYAIVSTKYIYYIIIMIYN